MTQNESDTKVINSRGPVKVRRDLIKTVKVRAAETNTTVQGIVEEALSDWLTRNARAA